MMRDNIRHSWVLHNFFKKSALSRILDTYRRVTVSFLSGHRDSPQFLSLKANPQGRVPGAISTR